MTVAAFSSADLAFAPVEHQYFLPHRRRVPSVTEILRSVGVSVDFNVIARISADLGEAIELKRDLGHALHADAHAFDDDDLLWETVDPQVEPYLRAWATFRDNSGLVPVTRERMVYHGDLGYCGTFDGIFRRANGALVLVDIKTGNPADSGCQYQTAGYQLAHEAEHPNGERVSERWGVQLTPGNRIPYRVFPYSDWNDFNAWRAFVTTYFCQASRRAA